MAVKQRGKTGENLLQMLETRLDNVVYRMGFSESRAHARTLVVHGHFNVNGRRTNIPSMLIRPGDEIIVREGSRKRTYFKSLGELVEARSVPRWLERDAKTQWESAADARASGHRCKFERTAHYRVLLKMMGALAETRSFRNSLGRDRWL
jgi:ribosomal protein S4